MERYKGYAVMYEGAISSPGHAILRNIENLLVDMVERPEMAHYLFEKFTDFYCEDITRALEATRGGFDMYCEWSDYGTQRGLLMSRAHVPDLHHALPQAHDRRLPRPAGSSSWPHSCGAIRPVIPN